MSTRINLLLLCILVMCSILSTPVAADPVQRDATLAEMGIHPNQPARRSLLDPPVQQEVVPAQPTTSTVPPPATVPYQEPTYRNESPVRTAQADDYRAPGIPAQASDGAGFGIGGLGIAFGLGGGLGGGLVGFILAVIATLVLWIFFIPGGVLVGAIPRFYFGSSSTQDWASVLWAGFLLLCTICSGAIVLPPVWGWAFGLIVAIAWAGWKLAKGNYGGTTPPP